MSREYMIGKIIENIDKLDLHFLKCVLIITNRLAN